MFMFFPYKLPFFRGWSIATVDCRGIQKTTKPQVTRLVMNRLLSASLRQCWAGPNIGIYWNIWKFPQYATIRKKQKKHLQELSSFEMFWVCFNLHHQPPQAPSTPSNVPNFKKVALATGRPSDWWVRSPKRHPPGWCLDVERLWNGKLSKSEQKNYSALTSLFADYGFKYHYWLVVCNIWIMTFHILGMSSSQLTNSYFFRGVGIPPTSMDIFHSPLTCQVCEIWWREFNTNMIVSVCDESYS